MSFTKSNPLLLLTIAILSCSSSVQSLQHLSRVLIGKWKVTKSNKAHTIPPSLFLVRRYSTVLEERKGKSFDDDDTPLESSDKKIGEEGEQQHFPNSRRKFLTSTSLSLLSPLILNKPTTANALGLVQFPCKDGLNNNYHLLTAGQSLMDAQNIWSTNPLFLTSRESALSDAGVEQIERACEKIREQKGLVITAVRYSLAANCMDSASIIGRELKIGRDRLLPEYTFLDPRAVGYWDMSPRNTTEAAVWAMDNDEAGPLGSEARPPANDDGTPNETLEDQAVRLRQLLSVLETLYSGDNILLVFPDGTGPAVLTALIGGIPLNRVHEAHLYAGELRFNVTYDNARTFFDSNPHSAAYSDILKNGRKELQLLRETPDKVINVKELRYEEEKRLEEEAAAAQRLQRMKEEEEEARQKKALLASSTTTASSAGQILEDNGVLNTFVSIGALAVVGASAAAISSDKSSNDTDTVSKQENVPLSKNDDTLQQTKETPETMSLFDDPVTTNIYEEQLPLTKTERIEMADKAMEEYLDQDDGGDAWLSVLSDIIDDDDDDGKQKEEEDTFQ